MTTVFSMVQKVLADSEMKLRKMAAEGAEDGEETMGEATEKKDAKKNGNGEKKEEEQEKEASLNYSIKVAEACDYLADNLPSVVDDRTPAEKLAEYMAIQEELLKRAEDVPVTPPLDTGVGPGGPSSAMKAEETNTPGGPILQGGDSGQATGGNQPDKSPSPSESATPADANTAMESNKDMMMGEQPENILKQSSDREAQAILQLFAQKGYIKLAQEGEEEEGEEEGEEEAAPKKNGNGKKPMAEAEEEDEEDEEEGEEEKKASHIPARFARVLSKFAGDGEAPASISAGTEPILQSAAGVPNVQMQGTEAGEQVPPTKGMTDGRSLIASNQAAIDATKGQAKKPVKSPLAEVLSEPALSSAHDNVLQKSLDSTSEAGVKISAARELLRKIAASSPEAMEEIKRMVKAAEEGAPIPPPGDAVGGAVNAVATEAPVSDEAMAAAAEGVTTDELAKAQTLMAAQAQEGAAAAAPAAGEGAAPEAGAAGGAPEAAVPPEAAPVA